MFFHKNRESLENFKNESFYFNPTILQWLCLCASKCQFTATFLAFQIDLDDLVDSRNPSLLAFDLHSRALHCIQMTNVSLIDL